MIPTRTSMLLHSLMIVLVFGLLLGACASPDQENNDERAGISESYLSVPADLSSLGLPGGEKIRVVATTSIVADVVSKIGGDVIELTTLMPANVDPHSYEPTPADLQAVSEAHVVFINGLGLEEFLAEMLENVGTGVPVLSLSEGLDLIVFGDEVQAKDEHDLGTFDPHVWFDPTNVMVWIDRVAQVLSLLDPGNVALYEKNGEEYHEQLRILDQWIFVEVSKIPAKDRILVTDHRVFEYFAKRYGFDVGGAVIPVFSSAAEPSAREMADLHDRILDLGIKVIFVGEAINPDIVEAIAQDTETRLVFLFTGSLSEEEGAAGNYLALMRYNVESIVNALLE